LKSVLTKGGANGKAGSMDEPVVLGFADNRLLPLLYGAYDRHLARIEQSLGVRLSSRGNKISISGSESTIALASAALNALYERLEKNLPVDDAEVDAAIRLASARIGGVEGGESVIGADAVLRTPRRHLTPRSARQAEYVRALADAKMVFGIGPAGTGKTYLAVAMAVSMLISGRVERIILSRPAVEAGERLGFLPGDLRDKIDPYLAPLYDALYDMLPGDQVVNRLNSGEIEVAPLAFMRGRTLSHSYVILDEAQNATRIQMRMFLTRLGEGSHMAINGDPSQVDLPPGSISGLSHAVETLADIDAVKVVRFTDVDIVRHQLVTQIVQAYDADDRRGHEGGGQRNRAPDDHVGS
jgi:phosphate starvation-inducible PhoH-like protein